MADVKALTMTAGQLAGQQSTDNLILQGPLDLNGFRIISSNGNIQLSTPGNVISGNAPTTNNYTLGYIGCGDSNNTFNGTGGFIGAGINNRASGNHSSVGGNNNDALSNNSVIAGGKDNTVNAVGGSIWGGLTNLGSADYTNAAGNSCNATASNATAVGWLNTATSNHTVVLGGKSNTATTNGAIVVGGNDQSAGGSSNSVILGGLSHTVNAGTAGSIFGGYDHLVLDDRGVCLGGYKNFSGNTSSGGAVAGCRDSKASQNACIIAASTLEGYQVGGVYWGNANEVGEGNIGYVEYITSSGKIRNWYNVRKVSTLSSANGTVGYTVDGVLAGDVYISCIRGDGAWGGSLRVRFTARKPDSGNAVFCTGRAPNTNPMTTVYTQDSSAINAVASISSSSVIITMNAPASTGNTYYWCVAGTLAYRMKT